MLKPLALWSLVLRKVSEGWFSVPESPSQEPLLVNWRWHAYQDPFAIPELVQSSGD